MNSLVNKLYICTFELLFITTSINLCISAVNLKYKVYQTLLLIKKRRNFYFISDFLHKIILRVWGLVQSSIRPLKCVSIKWVIPISQTSKAIFNRPVSEYLGTVCMELGTEPVGRNTCFQVGCFWCLINHLVPRFWKLMNIKDMDWQPRRVHIFLRNERRVK